jgi:hypothetical protein
MRSFGSYMIMKGHGCGGAGGFGATTTAPAATTPPAAAGAGGVATGGGLPDLGAEATETADANASLLSFIANLCQELGWLVNPAFVSFTATPLTLPCSAPPPPPPTVTQTDPDPGCDPLVQQCDLIATPCASGGECACGYQLIGYQQLDDAAAAAAVTVTPHSSVETSGPTAAANEAANNFNMSSPAAQSQLAYFYAAYASYPAAEQAIFDRVDGNCSALGPNPTTAEILQWAAYKWGLSPLLLYSEASQEGSWDQTSLGDDNCSASLVQVADCNNAEKPNHAYAGFTGGNNTTGLGYLPNESTCFAVDFYGAVLTAKYTGNFQGLDVTPGNVGTAIQSWYSGGASAPGDYTQGVCNIMNAQTWDSKTCAPPPANCGVCAPAPCFSSPIAY